MNSFKIHMNYLVKSYEAEECNFSEECNIKMLELFLSRMEDCHLKCVLYKHLEHLENISEK